MAKFRGLIGYAEDAVETTPGVWSEPIVEHPAFGDVVRTSRKLVEGESVNDDISVGNSISIVATAYAREHFFAIRYVKWAGAKWKVEEVTDDPDRPRLVLRLGGVFHDSTTEAS